MQLRKCLTQYMGGKSYIAEWIVSYMPKHTCYVEPFGGVASVLFTKPKSKVEVYNDKWDDIVLFFKLLRDEPQKLIDKLKLYPYSRKLHETLTEKFIKREFVDEYERAITCFYLLNTSINSIVPSAFSTSLVRNHARAFHNKVDGLSDFIERLREVIIENLDFRDIIKKYDSEETLFYFDPPYVLSGSQNVYYVPEFTYKDFYELSKLLNQVLGKVMLSIYPYENLKELYSNEWHYLEKLVPKRSTFVPKGSDSVYAGTRAIAKELLICNFKPKLRKMKSLIEIYGEA